MKDPEDALESSEGVAGLPVSRAELREWMTPKPFYILGKTLFLLALTAALAFAAHTMNDWVLKLPLYLLLGLVVNGLVQLGHDAWHQNLFPKPWQNSLYGHLFSSLFCVSYLAARHAHLRHHWYNRTSRDPDAYNVGRGWRPWLQFYLVVFAGLPLSPLHFNIFYPLAFFRRSDWVPHLLMLGLYALAYAGILSFCRHFQAEQLLFDLWIVPVLCATPWNGLKSIADHYANTWEGDRFHTATTVRTHPLLVFLWHGLNYHLDHHLFPRVPGHALPKVHAKIAPVLAERGSPVFDGYPSVFWRALKAGPTYVASGTPFLRNPP